MTRPATHRGQPHAKCCGNCQFAHLVAYKLDLLCFHGDRIEVVAQNPYPVESDVIYLNDEEVGLLEGDAYDTVWVKRVVDSDDVCDEWLQEDAN